MSTVSKIQSMKMALRILSDESLDVQPKADAPAKEKPPLAPYTGPGTRAPAKFQYEEYTLMPPDDARKVAQTLDALNDRAAKIKEMDAKATEMRVQVAEKIRVFQEEEGYEAIKQEAQSFTEKLSEQVEDVGERVGKVLLEYNDVVLGVVENLKKGKVTDAEQRDALLEKLKEFASPEIAGKIIAAADAATEELARAKDKVTRALKSWKPPKDLRKKIKQELPKGAGLCVRADGVVDTIKNFVSKAVGLLKSAWTALSDRLSSLVSVVDQAEPVVNEMKQLLGSATTGAKEEETTDGDAVWQEFEREHAADFSKLAMDDAGRAVDIGNLAYKAYLKGKDSAVDQTITGSKGEGKKPESDEDIIDSVSEVAKRVRKRLDEEGKRRGLDTKNVEII